jgi:hypothetical protein
MYFNYMYINIVSEAITDSTLDVDDAPATASLSPRWLSDVRTRIGKCIDSGISPTQIQEAASILQEINEDC